MELRWRQPIVTSNRSLALASVLALSIVFAACDDSAPATLYPGGPSSDQSVAASMNVAPAPDANFQNFGCQVGSRIPATVSVNVRSSQNVALDHVTIQMLDGTHLGGPVVTVPQSQLTTEFGTTLIVAGTPRTFVFNPLFPCTGVRQSVVADIGFVDPQGVAHSVSTSTSWPY